MNTLKPMYVLIAVIFLMLLSCKNSVKEESETEKRKTPVDIETLRAVVMDEIINLPAVSSYLKKETVRSSSTGFITEVTKSLGQMVEAGDMLMTIKTKEASALKALPSDSDLHISGLIHIKANSSGTISQIDHHTGDYVSEGDPLITLAQPGSLVFYLKVPYEEHDALHLGEIYTLLLPDGKRLRGNLIRLLTTVDAVSQSQDYLIEPQKSEFVPENLWVQVPVKKQHHIGNYSLPRVCVQCNETQTDFWVMRLNNDSMAVKVSIQKGIVSDSLVEILAPIFNRTDRFVAKGSYGLPDTAYIEISK
jgi:biotin carboxyl carrier protein